MNPHGKHFHSAGTLTSGMEIFRLDFHWMLENLLPKNPRGWEKQVLRRSPKKDVVTRDVDPRS